MHMLPSLSPDSELAIYHSENAVNILEHLYDNSDPTANVPEEAIRKAIASGARKQLEKTRARRAEQLAHFDINRVRWSDEGRD
ncbi:hypothetical protein MBLNU457_g2688t1 [Dothideomycetes sp. NU457]